MGDYGQFSTSNPFLKPEEKQTLKDLLSKTLESELTSGVLSSGTPAQVAAGLGIPESVLKKMDPGEVERLTAKAKNAALSSRVSSRAAAESLQGDTMERASLKQALEAKLLDPAIADATAKTISKYNMGNNPTDWTNAVNQKVMETRDHVANNRAVEVGKSMQAAAEMAIAADTATLANMGKPPEQPLGDAVQSLRAGQKAQQAIAGKENLTSGPRLSAVMEAFFGKDGFVPDYGRIPDMEAAGLIPQRPTNADTSSGALLGRAMQSGEISGPGGPPGVEMGAAQSGPLAGGAHVYNPDPTSTLSFTGGPQGIVQQGVTPPPDPPLPAAESQARMKVGLPLVTDYGPGALPPEAGGVQFPTSAGPPMAAEPPAPAPGPAGPGQAKPDPQSFAFEYKRRHPEASVQEIRQLYYQQYGF